MYFLRSTLFFLVALYWYQTTQARSDESERLAGFIENVRKTVEIVPGISVTVAGSDSVLFCRAFGYADLEEKVPATKETAFYIASSTKPFVGLLALILQEDGLIDLDAQVTDYKPFSDFSSREVFSDVTLLDLLTHQSGIDNPYLSMKLAYSGDYTKEQILRLTEEETRRNEKGKVFEYSNFGYYMFSLLLQEHLGLDWRHLLRDRLFIPLGMTGTTAFISGVEESLLAKPYLGLFPQELIESPVVKTDELMHAAGGLVYTASDAARFISFLCAKGKAGDVQVYPSSLVKRSQEKIVETSHDGVEVFNGTGYGVGWRIGDYHGEPCVYHFGGYSGFFNHLSFLPQRGIGISISGNHDMAMPVADLIAQYAYDLYLGNEERLVKHEKYLEKDLPNLLDKYRSMEIRHREKLAGRTWELSLPQSAYAGTYRNAKLGDVTVSVEDDDLVVRYGKLQAVATPYPSPDCIRIEMIPGSGTVICFDAKEGIVKSVYQGGLYYDRVGTE